MVESLLQAPTALTDWVSAIANSISSLGILVGLCVGWRQLNIWKRQIRQQRKAEVADKVFSSAHSAVDVMNSVRSPFERIPKAKLGNKTHVFEQRALRLIEASSIFQDLRYAQVRASVLLQDPKVDKVVEQIFQTRIDFWNALDILIDYSNVAGELHDNEKSLVKDARRTVYASYGNSDTLHQQLSQALKELEVYLGPTMRLNE